MARSLENIELFNGLAPQTLADLVQKCRWKRYAKGEEIITKAAEDRDVYVLTEGRVEVIGYSSGGRHISFANLEAGECFGTIAALDGERRSATAVALTEATLAVVPAPIFRNLIEDHPSIAVNLLHRFVKMIRKTDEKLVQISVYGAPFRVQAELLRLAETAMVTEQTAMISPAPTQNDIASHAVTARETVARVFGQLTKKKIIRRAPGTLYITDVPALRAMVEEGEDETL